MSARAEKERRAFMPVQFNKMRRNATVEALRERLRADFSTTRVAGVMGKQLAP